MLKIPCNIEEATKYVEENCEPYEQVDEVKSLGNEINEVWWTDTKYQHSNRPARKVAHYNSKQGMLYVY